MGEHSAPGPEVTGWRSRVKRWVPGSAGADIEPGGPAQLDQGAPSPSFEQEFRAHNGEYVQDVLRTSTDGARTYLEPACLLPADIAGQYSDSLLDGIRAVGAHEIHPQTLPQLNEAARFLSRGWVDETGRHITIDGGPEFTERAYAVARLTDAVLSVEGKPDPSPREGQAAGEALESVYATVQARPELFGDAETTARIIDSVRMRASQARPKPGGPGSNLPADPYPPYVPRAY